MKLNIIDNIINYIYKNDIKLTEKILNEIIHEDIYKDIYDVDIFTNKNQNYNILLTGSTGFLGCNILYELINKQNVNKIFCLVRAHKNYEAIERLKETLIKNKLFNNEILKIFNKKVIVLISDLGDINLGQDKKMYEFLCKEIDCIIHCAWNVKWNLSIKEFNDDINALKNLIKFTKTKKIKRFHFISTINVIFRYNVIKVPEKILERNPKIPMPIGYSLSKYIAEHMLIELLKKCNIPIQIYRLGQISGHSETGVWINTKDISARLIVGGIYMKKMPNRWTRYIDWIPVNFASSAIVDICLQNFDNKNIIYHITNPNVVEWKEFLNILKKSNIIFKTINSHLWINEIYKSKENPLYKARKLCRLFVYWTSILQREFPLLDVNKTIQKTEIIINVPKINEEIIKRYIIYWKEINFLNEK